MELVKWRKKFAGYCLDTSIEEEIAAIEHGDGANGKSVDQETKLAVMG